MSVLFVVNYRVTNPEGFAPYGPAVEKVLADHGAEVLAVDLDSEVMEGEPNPVTIVLRFESREAAKAWYHSPEYQDIIGLRTDNSEGSMVLVEGR